MRKNYVNTASEMEICNDSWLIFNDVEPETENRIARSEFHFLQHAIFTRD